MARPSFDRVGYVTILLDDDQIDITFDIRDEFLYMHADPARAAVLKDHDWAAVRSFEQIIERVERFNIQKCCGHYGSVLCRAKPREDLAIGNKIRCREKRNNKVNSDAKCHLSRDNKQKI